MKNLLFSTAAALAVAAAFNPVHALGDEALTNADDLVVAENQVHELAGGAHYFDDLVIADGATLIVQAGTTLNANRLHADGGRIVYAAGSANGGTPTITLVSQDSRHLRDLEVIGHGADGADATQTPAATGSHGRDARCRVTLTETSFRSSTRGGNGHDGVSGSAGEDGAQLVAYFVGAEPGALIRFNSVGGDGGRGQPGGASGNGGEGSSCRSASSGGVGGDGGAGGAAGDSGRVTVFMIPVDDETVQPDWIRIAANVAAGQPGDGGARGPAGRRGQPGSCRCRWRSWYCSERSGHRGLRTCPDHGS
jgi:hypothetical protein